MNRPLAGLAVVATVVALLLAIQTQTFSWVDAGGPKVRMSIAGSGSPTVVFDTGGGGSLELWGMVPSEVSRFAKTVSYDRAGNGMSEKPTTVRDARNIAAELHAALRSADLAPPYILVGHSVGGLYVRVFTGMYPNEVAGLVLVDPTQEQTQAWAKEHGLAPSPYPLPRGEGRVRGECTLDDERSCDDETFAQASESAVPPDVPVFLIHVMFPWPRPPFPSKDLDELQRTQMERVAVRLKFHKEWVDEIPGAKLIVTENSSHGGINFEEPELVARTIIDAIEIARATRGLK